MKDEFHHIIETKLSIKSLLVIDYAVVDSRASPCKPKIIFCSTVMVWGSVYFLVVVVVLMSLLHTVYLFFLFQ